MAFLLPEKLFSQETVKKLFCFLQSKHWVRKPTNFPHSVFYISTSGETEGIKLIFPTNIIPDNIAHRRQVSDSVSTLANLYAQEPMEFWNKIQGLGEAFDTLYLIEREGEPVNSVLAFPMLSLISRLLNTLDCALDSVSADSSSAFSITEYSRLGHSFTGSYGITLEVPMKFQYELPFETAPQKVAVPEERKAIELTFEMLQTLKTRDNSSLEKLFILLQDEPPLSDALYALVQDALRERFTIDAMPAAALPFSDGSVQKVKFIPEMLEVVNHIRSQIPPQESRLSPFETEGMVVGLSRPPERLNIMDNPRGLTIKLHDEENNRKITIKNINVRDYLLAFKAQRQGVPIKVMGQMDMNKKRWILEDVRFEFPFSADN